MVIRFMCLVCVAVILGHAIDAQSKFRRGNPTPTLPRSEFFIIDSDDDSPRKPSFRFVDTLTGTWTRVNGFSNPDDGYAQLPNTVDSILMPFYLVNVWALQPPVPTPMGMTLGSSISTNGTICLYGIDTSAQNESLPNTNIATDLVAPLWADWEMLSGANQTKVYVRPVQPDSFYVSFYNLGLKGTNGQIRATFQVLFCRADSSITFEYRSFDGSLNGVPAAQIIQSVSTIGMMSRFLNMGATYLHKGNYFATSTNGHAQNLHNSLAVKFLHMGNESIGIVNVSYPPNDRYELPSNGIVPSCDIHNETPDTTKVFVVTNMTNITSGVVFYTKHDSIVITPNNTATYYGPSTTLSAPGNYKVNFSISYRNLAQDEWSDNNTYTRYFVYLGSASVPFRDEFNTGILPSLWSNAGADARDATTTMYTPDAPITTGVKAVVINRLDASGQSYPIDAGGDTLASAPIDLSGQTGNVYVYFHYQRGLLSDTSKAGILSRLNAGPDMPVRLATGVVSPIGDTLLVEGLKSAGSTWNPSESSWAVIGAIPGGFDVTTQTFRAALSSQFIHDHFRLRFRLKARNDAGPRNYFEDADNFILDAIHVEPFQIHKTELEPIDVDLGNGIYTHVPRDLTTGLRPRVRILNNGDVVALGQTRLHLRVSDALGRAVYDQALLVDLPPAMSDQWFTMPAWDIHGSQGGVFTALVTLEVTYYDSYHPNDTNRFYKTMYIDDRYSLDDNQPDSLPGVTTANTNFYYDFTPISTDSLRGVAVYYTGSSVTSNWNLVITANGNIFNRTFSVLPSGAGAFTATFAPVPMRDTTNYHMHFTMTSGSNLAGDGTNGLVYYTVMDSNTSNNRYGMLRPDILSHFSYSTGSQLYSQPKEADAAVGGFILPMFRLVFSGAANYLPVTLASLSAMRSSDGSVIVQWKTAEEHGAAQYEIERIRTTSVIAQTAAKNISSGADYIALDRDASHDAELYELFERDLDGSRRSLGQVLAAPYAATGDKLQLSAFPNPAIGTLTLASNRPLGAVLLIDPMGRTVKSLPSMEEIGNMDVTDLPSGSYLLRGSSMNESATVRVTIVH